MLVIKTLIVIMSLFSLVFAQGWFNSPKEGLKVAKERGLPVMFYFYSEYCNSCKQMKKTVFSDEKVSRMMDRFVVISLDLLSEEGKVWGKRFNVYGTPAIVFYDAKNDRALDVVFGSRSKEQFMAILSMMCLKMGLERC